MFHVLFRHRENSWINFTVDQKLGDVYNIYMYKQNIKIENEEMIIIRHNMQINTN